MDEDWLYYLINNKKMILFRSIKRNAITQRFGQNKLPIYKKMGMKGHNGIDFSVQTGNPIYWNCDTKGIVYHKEVDDAGGIGLDIISEDGEMTYKHRFWHLKGYTVEIGDTVETGDLIAISNNTGKSTAAHLHWGIKPVRKLGTRYVNIYQMNGYFGGINPKPFFANVFVLDYVNNLKKQISIIRKVIYLYQLLINKIIK